MDRSTTNQIAVEIHNNHPIILEDSDSEEEQYGILIRAERRIYDHLGGWCSDAENEEEIVEDEYLYWFPEERNEKIKADKLAGECNFHFGSDEILVLDTGDSGSLYCTPCSKTGRMHSHYGIVTDAVIVDRCDYPLWRHIDFSSVITDLNHIPVPKDSVENRYVDLDEEKFLDFYYRFSDGEDDESSSEDTSSSSA
tara:strand:+ start:6684 stop:7271 length:588 start_codon:yes stop_codon:yes gene_type:complete